MNFSQLKTEVKRITGRNDSGFDDRIDKALNRALRQWAREQPWVDLKRTIDVTHQGGRTMVLPSEVERVCWIMDKTNSNEVEASGQWDRTDEHAYSQGTTGYAQEWEMAGRQPTMTGVSGPLAIYSSDASDVLTVYVVGQVENANGGVMSYYEAGETVNVVGATPVTLSTSFVRVDSICKDADSTGVIKVDSQGSTVALLGPLEREGSYPVVRFMDVPQSGVVFRCGCYTKPSPLVNAYQSPPPAVDADYLIYMAAHEICWQLREGDRSVGSLKKAKDIAKDERSVDMMFGDSNMRIVPEEGD